MNILALLQCIQPMISKTSIRQLSKIIFSLKSCFRAAKYFKELIKFLPENPEPILFEQVFGRVASLGCIHHVKVHCFSALIGGGIVYN